MGKLKGSELVVKANQLIEARYRLTLVEQQIIGFAIVRAREEDKGLFADHPLTIRAVDFAAQFNCDVANAYGQLKEAIEKLFDRKVVIRGKEDDGSDFVKTVRWISEMTQIKRDRSGEINFIFAPTMIDYVTRLEKSEFTQYRLSQIGNMTSWYAIRIYELLVQYLKIRSRTITLKELKEILCIENEYSRIFDFQKWVIDVAVDQINEHTDLTVSYEPKKNGRVVDRFVFTIKSKLKPKKKLVVDRAYIEKNALPGETYETAKKRLSVGVQTEIEDL